jgi:hypothetical protein
MSYVPPHLRNKQQSTETNMQEPFKKDRRPHRRTYEIQKEQVQREADEKRKIAKNALEKTEENFPVLVNSSTSTTWNNGRKFSELAANWLEKEEEEKRKREEDEKDFGPRGAMRPSSTFSLPMFRPTRRFSEREEYRCEEEKPAPKPVGEDDGWTVVDNTKYRKPKPKCDSDDDGVNEQKKEEDTVWSGPEEHETCWDDRRY